MAGVSYRQHQAESELWRELANRFMLRKTHVVLGAAVALPVAFPLDPAPAAGALLLGMAGGVVPDYLDLRSEAKGLLKHRGASHGVFVAALAVAGAYLLLTGLSQVDDPAFRLEPSLVRPLTLAFALGLVSHLVSDACTFGGIRPLLPFSGVRLWLLPGFLRFPSKGTIDRLTRGAASLVVMVAVALYLLRL